MAARADWEMLNQAIVGAGNAAEQRRREQYQRDMEMQRVALEQQMRDIQEARYNAQGEHFNRMEQQNSDANAQRLQLEQQRLKKADSPRIQAYLTDPTTGSQMTFQGTYEQLQQAQDAFKQQHGRDLNISPAPPGAKHEVGRVTVGGATHIFYDYQKYQDFLKGLKDAGITPDQPKTSASNQNESEISIKHPATEAQPAEEAQPESKGFLGLFAHPATAGHPAIPAQPEWTERIKRNIGTNGAPLGSLSDLQASLPPSGATAAPSGIAAPPTQPLSIPQNHTNYVTVNSVDEWARLPEGTPYKDSNGNTFIKKGTPQAQGQQINQIQDQ